ncbi:MAG: hypothetical protein JWP03_1701 [Phycisphaerales bacterium]|nr:hypothetical protein [Phycisphaerales bacterium]
MSDQIFNFNPTQYAEQFAKEGWVHIRGGVTEEFYAKAKAQCDENMRSRLMKEFAIGDKQQAMYEFPPGGDYQQQVRKAMGAIAGLNAADIVLSERHVKGYEASAASEPNAHKDRYASQLSVGLSIDVREGSTLVLYPHDLDDINPFNTSQQLRTSLSPERYPEPVLKNARKVEILDQARDVIVFRGHRFWHLRRNPALTTMLYLKLNAFNCDPMGEDDRTEGFRKATLAAVELGDEQMEKCIPLIGRRVDYFHRHYTRDFLEVLGVVLWGEKHFTLDEDELLAIKAMDGKRPLGAVISAMGESTDRATKLAKMRRIARRGVIDLTMAG